MVTSRYMAKSTDEFPETNTIKQKLKAFRIDNKKEEFSNQLALLI